MIQLVINEIKEFKETTILFVIKRSTKIMQFKLIIKYA